MENSELHHPNAPELVEHEGVTAEGNIMILNFNFILTTFIVHATIALI